MIVTEDETTANFMLTFKPENDADKELLRKMVGDNRFNAFTEKDNVVTELCVYIPQYTEGKN